MSNLALAFDILARDRASKEIQHVGDAAEKTGGKLGGLGKALGTAAKVGGTAFLAVGAAATAFAAKSASTFKTVGGEVLKLQRYTGATAEEASRLRFAAKQSGIDVETMTKSIGLLSKNLAGTKLDKLGLDLKDAKGHVLPLNDSLLKIADRFQKMPNGAEKTALAMQLFGKSGAQMIPFLNKGAAGIAELEKQTDKYGQVLTNGDLDSVKEATKNQRLFSAAMEGLQLQVGRYVLPIMTKFTGFLASNMPTAIAFVRGAMQKLAPTIKSIGDVIDTVARGAAQVIGVLAAGDFKGGGPFAEDSPIVAGLFQFRDVLTKVVAFVQANLKPILIGLAVAFVALTAPVTGTIAVLGFLYLRFQVVRDVVAGVVSFFQTTVVPAFKIAATAIGNQFAQLRGWVSEHWTAIREAIGHVIVVVKAVIDGFIGAVGAAWRMWGDNIMTVVSTVFGVIQQVIKSVVGIISGIIETALNLINGDWGKAWDSFKGILSSAWEGVKGIISGAVTIVVSLVSGIGEAVGRAASGMFDGIKSAFVGAINFVIQKWNDLQFKIGGQKVFGRTLPSVTIDTPNIPLIGGGGGGRGPTTRNGTRLVAHDGGRLTRYGLEPLRADEVMVKARYGETIYPPGTGPAPSGGGDEIHVHVTQLPGEDQVDAANRKLKHRQRTIRLMAPA